MRIEDKIKEGQIIEIKKDRYDVLKKFYDIDWFDSKNNKVIGKHVIFELHKLGDFRLHPTHLLKVYFEENKIFLLEIIQEKPPKWLKRIRTRGEIFSFINKKRILPEEIKITSN